MGLEYLLKRLRSADNHFESHAQLGRNFLQLNFTTRALLPLTQSVSKMERKSFSLCFPFLFTRQNVQVGGASMADNLLPDVLQRQTCRLAAGASDLYEGLQLGERHGESLASREI